ncbi:3766_t:CDS:2 [Scutellospora calospora]|uniref:3766_t:CDS:1 n=1 Tax=Scutellospora calospora TaxID=85575 RepID=A0ACA9JU73_9GLOM|nr:3766_t:CDS:2 [Scutellospora calospora]
MSREPIVTRSRADQIVSETSFDEFNNSDNYSDQEQESANEESDYFDEFEITQNNRDLNYMDTSDQDQEIESSDIEINESTSSNTNTLSTVNSNKQSLSSYVWDFFVKLDTKQSQCKHCKRIYSEKTATSSLDRHIQTRHKGLFNDFQQTTLDRYLFTTPYSNEIQQKKITLLIKWIVVNLQAFMLVDNLYFKQFIYELDPRFRLPCRQVVHDNIISTFKSQRDLIKDFIFKLSCNITLTTDIWSSCTMTSFIGITCHFIDDNWVLRHILLDIFEIPSPHTGQVIANAILSLLEEFKLENKILALTSDNASNIILASSLIKDTLANSFLNTSFQHIHCAAHVMNLAVKEGLKLANIHLIKLRSFIRKIRKSVLLIEDLKRISASFYQTFLRPIIDCKTRWNSTFMMIDRALILRINLDSLVDLRNCLKPFNTATEILSKSNYPTIADLRLIISGLRNHLNTYNVIHQSLNLVSFKIKEKLDEYWPIIQETSKIAAFFDPHFKRLVYNEQSIDEILAPIYANLPVNIEATVQPSYISKRRQFIQEYTGTFMPNSTSDSDELVRYWETIPPPEEIFVCDW